MPSGGCNLTASIAAGLCSFNDFMSICCCCCSFSLPSMFIFTVFFCSTPATIARGEGGGAAAAQCFLLARTERNRRVASHPEFSNNSLHECEWIDSLGYFAICFIFFFASRQPTCTCQSRPALSRTIAGNGLAVPVPFAAYSMVQRDGAIPARRHCAGGNAKNRECTAQDAKLVDESARMEQIIGFWHFFLTKVVKMSASLCCCISPIGSNRNSPCGNCSNGLRWKEKCVRRDSSANTSDGMEWRSANRLSSNTKLKKLYSLWRKNSVYLFRKQHCVTASGMVVSEQFAIDRVRMERVGRNVNGSMRGEENALPAKLIDFKFDSPTNISARKC